MIDDSSANLARSSGFACGPLVPLFPGFTVSEIELAAKTWRLRPGHSDACALFHPSKSTRDVG
jgi:hypothetical protein